MPRRFSLRASRAIGAFSRHRKLEVRSCLDETTAYAPVVLQETVQYIVAWKGDDGEAETCIVLPMLKPLRA